MSSPEHADPAEASSPVRYGTDAFERALHQLLSEGDGQPAGTRILFHGGTREMRQQALATVTRHATANVHQFQVRSLLAEQRMQTQNNLRKAFDHAAEESALLYFDSTDALFSHSHVDTDEEEDAPEPTIIEYFFDRVGAYGGVVVLAVQRTRHVDYADDHVDVVVEFE